MSISLSHHSTPIGPDLNNLYREDMASAFLEIKFDRLEYVGNRLFDLPYMGHTWKWLEIDTSVSLEECFAAVKCRMLRDSCFVLRHDAFFS